MTNARDGVYCLANDGYIEWLQAFVRSFRLHNATLPLTVIPYSSTLGLVRQLAQEFDFSVMSEVDCERFDSLARALGGPASNKMFRRFACFSGPYEHFIYLDSDMVITRPLDDVLDAFAPGPYDFVYFDIDMRMVYRKDFAAEMIEKYDSRGFNAGAFVSRRGLFSEDDLRVAADAAMAEGDKLVRGNLDQAYLNYLVDTSGRPMANIDALLPGITPGGTWVSRPFHHDPVRHHVLDDEGRRYPFVHWAGWSYPTIVKQQFFLHYRTLGLPFIERLWLRARFYGVRWTNPFRQRVRNSYKAQRLLSILFGSGTSTSTRTPSR